MSTLEFASNGAEKLSKLGQLLIVIFPVMETRFGNETVWMTELPAIVMLATLVIRSTMFASLALLMSTEGIIGESIKASGDRPPAKAQKNRN